MSVRKYLPSAIAIASMLATPAFAGDLSALPSLPSLPSLPPLTQSAAPAPEFGDGADPFTGSSPAGPAHYQGWRGFYVGGMVGYTDGSADFSKATQGPIAYSLRNTTLESEFAPSTWQVLGTGNRTVAGFGGFAGYNFEYLTPNAKVVMGFEANYEQASLSFYAPTTPISRILPQDGIGNGYTVSISGTGSVTDLDYGTLRARAGWDAGNFLPYAFAGFVLGQANVDITETTVAVEYTSPYNTFTFPGAAGSDREWLYGLTVGAGLDVALTPNIFLRGEYEYVQFQKVAGTTIELNTARVGAGIRF